MSVICLACKNAYGPDDYVYITRCGHIFHRDCLFNWLVGTNTCPECYAICAVSDVHRLYLVFANETPEEESLSDVNVEIVGARQNRAEQNIMLSRASSQVSTVLANRNRLQADITNLRAKFSQEKQQQINELKNQIRQKKVVQQRLIEAKYWELILKVLTSSPNCVEEMLKEFKSQLHLARMIVLMRREIRSAEDKRKAFRVVLRDSQEENTKLKAETRELSAKHDNLKKSNFILWDNLLNSQVALVVDQSKKRDDKKEDNPKK